MNKSDRAEFQKFLRRQPADSLSTPESRVALLGRFLAWMEAISLAIEERTGCPAPDEAEYSAADEARAEEILRLYPRPDLSA